MVRMMAGGFYDGLGEADSSRRNWVRDAVLSERKEDPDPQRDRRISVCSLMYGQRSGALWLGTDLSRVC